MYKFLCLSCLLLNHSIISQAANKRRRPYGTMSEPKPEPSKKALVKARSWSPDTQREAVWLRRKMNLRRMQRCRSKSFTNSDVDELGACFELGFGFELDSPDLDPKLSSAFPALEFYCAVNKLYRSYSLPGSSSSSLTISSSDSDTSSLSAGSFSSYLFEPGDDPEVKKMRLRQWAKVVACSVRHSSPS